MKLRILFVDYDPESDGVMPNAMEVVDEFMEDEHGGIPQFFHDKKADLRMEAGADNVREMIVTIPDQAVIDLFDTPTVKGTVET